jgi:tetratricopeptide (TPR) repeat protein
MRFMFSMVILLALTAASSARNALWQSDATIWGPTLETFPRKARGYNEVGLYLLEQGKYDDAYLFLRRSLELDPYQPIWNNLGQAYEGLGQIDQAIKTFERAIWSTPNDATAYYNLGKLYLNRLRDRDKAMGYLLKARDLNPLEPDIHYQLSLAYSEIGDLGKAREELERYDYLKR